VLFVVSGLAFAPVARTQRRMLELVRQAGSGELDWARYGELSRTWGLWGSIALGTPLIAVVLMVLKPMLPTLR
jgi:uncharacterized membrane protein